MLNGEPKLKNKIQSDQFKQFVFIVSLYLYSERLSQSVRLLSIIGVMLQPEQRHLLGHTADGKVSTLR